MSNQNARPDEVVVSKSHSKDELKKPPLYKVLLHNDNFTTMEFVVFVLQTVFNHSTLDSVSIMLQVHNQGIGIAGIYTYEIAEAKVAKVAQIAAEREFPLLCTMEKE